jgi:hypothetical protein
MMCYYLIKRVLLTQLIECAGFLTLRMQRHRQDPLGLRTESGSVLLGCYVFMMFYLMDDLMLTFLT